MPTPTDSKPNRVTRREFLHYAWGASLALLLTEAGGAALWFMLPNRTNGEIDGIFTFDAGKLPLIGTSPLLVSDSKLNTVNEFWLSNSSDGLFAFDIICPHNYRDRAFKWVSISSYECFICPVCGSRFHADGTAFYGPSPRNLDSYVVTAYTPHGTLTTPSEGGPVNIRDATSIMIDMQQKIIGKPQAWR